MAVIIFIGVDKTGKSTLFKEVLKKTNKHICIDRFAPCQFVYGSYHKKGHPELSELRKLEEYLVNSPVPFFYVFVKADVEVIKKRFEEHKEADIRIDDIKSVQDKYEQYVWNTSLQVLTIDTTSSSISRCASKILDFANNLDAIWKL